MPKVGTIKTQAKGAGIETNVRMVQGYLQSKAAKWADKKALQSDVVNDVYNAFTSADANEKIKNPFTQKDTINKTDAKTADDSLQIRTSALPTTVIKGTEGSTIVVIPDGPMDGTVTFTVYGLDNAGAIATTVNVKP